MSQAVAPSVSVIIPVFNQSALTRRCLDSLLANSLCLKEVLVINNASTDDTAALLTQYASQPNSLIRVITNTQNLGFGRAVNQGFREATGDYLVELNNDTWVMHGWDQALVDAMRALGVDVVSPYFYERPHSDDLTHLAKQFVRRNHGRARHHFAAICFMIRRGAYDRLKFDHGGLFDERFFVTYEDTDLLKRMGDLGIRYAQTGSCFLWHHSMATRQAPGALPPRYEQEGLRLFIEKWGYDPRPADHTLAARLRRRWWKIKNRYGIF